MDPAGESQANVVEVSPTISIAAFAEATTPNQTVNSAHHRRTWLLGTNVPKNEIKLSPAGKFLGDHLCISARRPLGL